MRRHSWIPITLALFGLILGYAYFKRQQPVYEATSVAQFGSEQNSLLGLNSVSTPGLGDEKSVNTLIQAAKSREVVGRVVSELNLTQLAGFSGGHPANSKEARENAISTVSSMIRITLRKDTRLIDFNVTGANPEQVASLSNQAVLSLVAELESQKSKTLQGAIQALVAEGQRLQEKLKKSEIAMHDYKRSNQAISLDERKDLVLSKLKELGSELNQQSKERLTLETQLQACKEELQLTTILADAVHLLESSCDHARELERRLQEQLKKQESEALDLEQLAVQYNVLKREMESDQAVYESVLTRIKQVDVSKGMETPPIWVHQLAMVPGEPVSPNAKKVVGSSTAGGFMLGLAIIGLIVMQDRSIRSVDDARQKLRTPVLGMIANLPHHPDTKDGQLKGGHDTSHGLTPALLAHKAVAESFREFRAIIARMAKSQQTCHMVVSAVPDEGKTFVSTHLAVSLASQGYRTLLIDMDLRLSQLAQVFGIPGSRKGVIDLLLEEASFAEVCLSGGIAHLAIMPAGKRVDNPAELLSTCGVERLKEMAFAAGFDRIVIDTAPLIPVNDTLELGGLADSTFLVVRCNRTPTDVIQEAIRKLQQTGIPLSGLVLNRLTQRTRSHDYYYHRSYYKAVENEESAPLRPISRGFNAPHRMD